MCKRASLNWSYTNFCRSGEQYVLRPDVHDRVARTGLELLKMGAGECTRNNLEIFNFAEEYFDNISDEQWPQEGSKRQSKYSTFKRKF